VVNIGHLGVLSWGNNKEYYLDSSAC